MPSGSISTMRLPERRRETEMLRLIAIACISFVGGHFGARIWREYVEGDTGFPLWFHVLNLSALVFAWGWVMAQ
jgi:hypothetical protein